MIYTITFNPAIDLVIKVPNVQLGELNRSIGESYVAGGKGINMSVILKRLGLHNTAVAFLGGFSGEYIKQELQKDGIDVQSFEVDNITRINVKVKSEEETEINAAGAFVSRKDFEKMLAFFNQELKENDTVFLAGNKAPGMTSSDYVAIAKLCKKRNVNLVLDTTKELLTECLEHAPFIIKPNHHELGEIFNVTVKTEEEIIMYAKKLQEKGARNVLVSRGGEGSLLVTEDNQILTANVPKGKVVNSVGAGDSMLAGFMAKYIEEKNYAKALKQGAATGSATAFSVGIAEKSLIDELLNQIVVQKIK